MNWFWIFNIVLLFHICPLAIHFCNRQMLNVHFTANQSFKLSVNLWLEHTGGWWLNWNQNLIGWTEFNFLPITKPKSQNYYQKFRTGKFRTLLWSIKINWWTRIRFIFFRTVHTLETFTVFRVFSYFLFSIYFFFAYSVQLNVCFCCISVVVY